MHCPDSSTSGSDRQGIEEKIVPYTFTSLGRCIAYSGSEELGESSNMISEDEGDVIFRRTPGRGAVLTDSESELDGEISRNSSRSASFDQVSGGSEPDDVDLGPGDLRVMMVVIAVGRVPVLAHHQLCLLLI